MLSAHSSIIYIMTVSHVSLHSFSEKCTPCNIILYLNAHCLYSVRVRSCSHWLSIDLAQMWVVNMDRGRGRGGRGMEGNIPFHTRNKVWKWHFSCSYKDHRYKCKQGELHQPHWGSAPWGHEQWVMTLPSTGSMTLLDHKLLCFNSLMPTVATRVQI